MHGQTLLNKIKRRYLTLANAIDTAKVALAGLTPFINGVSKGMEQASAKMLDWAKTHK